MSTLGSPLKNQPGLNVSQAKTTDILLPNRFSFLEETYLNGQATPPPPPPMGLLAEVTKNRTFLKIQFSFKSTWFQGSKPIFKGARAQNGPGGPQCRCNTIGTLKG